MLRHIRSTSPVTDGLLILHYIKKYIYIYDSPKSTGPIAGAVNLAADSQRKFFLSLYGKLRHVSAAIEH